MGHIIHFTEEFSSIESILKSSSLCLHYCKEDFSSGNSRVSRAAHPMVSFSEYVINSINKKLITYGKYGIAFRRDWVKRNKIHPVLYVDKDSLIANALAALLIARRKNAEQQLAPNVKLSIMMVKCFTNNAIGYNESLHEKNFNFRNEKEWRYVPTKSDIGNKRISLDRRVYKAEKPFYNNQLKSYALQFSLKDISYVFVETQKQVDVLHNTFGIEKHKIKISRWSLNENKKIEQNEG